MVLQSLDRSVEKNPEAAEAKNFKIGNVPLQINVNWYVQYQ